MAWVWRPIDAVADFLRHRIGVQAQLRLGVLMTILGGLYLCYTPFAHEPPLIYTMSALALLFAGVGVVVSAETLAEVAGDVEDIKDQCESCGLPVPRDG